MSCRARVVGTDEDDGTSCCQMFVVTTIILLCRYSGHKPRLLWTFADDVAARPAGSTVVAHNSRTPSRTYNDSMAHLQRTWSPTTIVHVVTRRRDPSAEPASYHTLRHTHHIRRTIVRATGSRTPLAGTTRPPHKMKTDPRTTLLRRRVPTVILYIIILLYDTIIIILYYYVRTARRRRRWRLYNEYACVCVCVSVCMREGVGVICWVCICVECNLIFF